MRVATCQETINLKAFRLQLWSRYTFKSGRIETFVVHRAGHSPGGATKAFRKKLRCCKKLRFLHGCALLEVAIVLEELPKRFAKRYEFFKKNLYTVLHVFLVKGRHRHLVNDGKERSGALVRECDRSPCAATNVLGKFFTPFNN